MKVTRQQVEALIFRCEVLEHDRDVAKTKITQLEGWATAWSNLGFWRRLRWIFTGK